MMTAVDFAQFVDELATVSGEAILPFFRTSMTPADKSRGGVFDPVTEADRAGEVALRRMIEATFPRHGIIGEEFGATRADAEYVWVLDPIDGTKSFISGLPMWGTLIGLNHQGRPCYGMMHQPFTRERFFGDGAVASWRGPSHRPGEEVEERKLKTRPCASLAQATLMTTSPRLISENQRAAYFKVEEKVRLVRYGGDCYGYCALAAGHVDLVIESNLKPHDVVALIPIIEGAGGIVTTWDGGDAAGGGAIIAAGDERAHAAALDILSGASR
jgi:myo-inositol-1(or 4)-monophosphatase